MVRQWGTSQCRAVKCVGPDGRKLIRALLMSGAAAVLPEKLTLWPAERKKKKRKEGRREEDERRRVSFRFNISVTETRWTRTRPSLFSVCIHNYQDVFFLRASHRFLAGVLQTFATLHSGTPSSFPSARELSKERELELPESKFPRPTFPLGTKLSAQLLRTEALRRCAAASEFVNSTNSKIYKP